MDSKIILTFKTETFNLINKQSRAIVWKQ